MSIALQPALPQIRVEIHNQADIGFLDDGLRDGWGTVGLGPASESFANVGGDTGDYAIHTVDSSGAETRSAYEKDINPPFALSTNTFDICRVRVWEASGEAQYYITVYYTDLTNTSSGWRNCTDAPEEYEMALAAGKTINIIRLYIRAQDLASTVTVHWDYVMFLANSPWVPSNLTYGGDPNKCLVVSHKAKARFRQCIVINDCHILLYYDHALQASYPDAGAIVFLYAAHYNEGVTEYLREKLFKGRIHKVTHPTQDEITYVNLYCVDLIEDITDEIYSAEYEPTASTLSSIAQDIIDTVGIESNLNFWEMSRDSVRTTSNSIVKIYKNRPALELLNELAQTAQFAGPYYGAIVYLDMGGDIHFERIGYYSGWYAIAENNTERYILLERSLDDLCNDITLVYEEESVFPGDKNQWDETDEDGGGAPDYWRDSAGTGVWAIDGADYKSGVGCARVTWAVDPGSPETIGRGEINRINWFYADRIKFWIKRGVVWQGWSLHLVTAYGWLGAAYHDSGAIAVPAINTWVEVDIPRSSFTRVNEPGDDIVSLEWVLTSAVGIGPGTIRFDKIRFIHDERNSNQADATSKSSYGVHKQRIVNTNFKSQAEADDWAENYLEAHKNPRFHIIQKCDNTAPLAGAQGNMPYRPGNRTTVSARHTALNLNATNVSVMSTEYSYDARRKDPWSVIIESGNEEIIPVPVQTDEMRASNMQELQRIRQNERSEIQWHR